MESRDMLLRIFGALMFGVIACIDDEIAAPSKSVTRLAALPVFHQPQTPGACIGRVDAPRGFHDGDTLTIWVCPPGVQRGAQVTPP